MSTTAHVHAQLSALLDDALGPADRRTVESHLAGCAQCRARLADLRATASLIASLPDPVPSRRLLPRLAAPPMWLAPLRTLATLASGLSVFLFIASSFLASAGQLASGTAAAPAASRADTTVLASGAARSGSTPAPLAPNVGAASASPDISSDSAKAVSPTSAPSAFAAVPAPTSDPNAAAQAAAESASRDQAARATTSRSLGPSPWVWLALAIATGALALALQRRLRSS